MYREWPVFAVPLSQTAESYMWRGFQAGQQQKAQVSRLSKVSQPTMVNKSMTPETSLFLDLVDIHRTLAPMLMGLPNHRRLIREADVVGDLDFIRERFGPDHADVVDIEAAAEFLWLRADALPRPGDLVGGCR